ncbi:MAG: response regulator [bacterium]|nr:response regulator [bacterium]
MSELQIPYGGAQPQRILTIDDEPGVRRSLRAYLEDSGFDVIEAGNGREGIEKIRSAAPDLVLCDLRMPEVDGLDVVRFVGENLPELPIIIVSGTGVIGDAVEAVRMGAWDYVLKPVEDMAAFEHIIVRSLERAALRRENRQYKEHLIDEVRRQTAEIRDQAEQLESINSALRNEIAERQRAEFSIAESERRYRELVENLQEGLCTVNPKTEFTYCNPAMGRIFEMPAAELVGRSVYDFLTEEGRTRMKQQTRERSQGRHGHYELEIDTPSGNIKHVIVRSRPLYDTNGDYCGATAIAQDITEQKKLESHLRHAQKMETVGTLAGGIAHDFNNNLTPILGFAEMAVADWDDKVSRRENIEQIVTAALRARDLVKQILVFSRQTESTREPTEIHLIVREAVKLLQSTLPANIEVIEDVDKSSGLVMADATQIHQLVMNLCTNAYHAMEDHGGELEVSLQRCEVDRDFAETYPSLKPGPHLRLTVSDTGCGMTRDLLEKVFEPFFTTKGVGKGTGLGLSLVHGIVAEHSGQVTVYSEPGIGTTFHIYLPQFTGGVASVEETSTALTGGAERILFVDDEAPIVRMAEKALRKMGYHIVTSTSSPAALELLESDPTAFDLLITDLNMPQLNGLALIERAQEIRPDLPIILASGFSERVTHENCAKYGIREFLMKPVIAKDLYSAIRRVLDSEPKLS